MKTYKLYFTIGFSIIAKTPDGSDITPDVLRERMIGHIEEMTEDQECQIKDRLRGCIELERSE